MKEKTSESMKTCSATLGSATDRFSGNLRSQFQFYSSRSGRRLHSRKRRKSNQQTLRELRVSSLHGIRILESKKFLLVESEFWALDSGIQLKESRTPLTIGIRNPRRGIQNPRISWNPLHESSNIKKEDTTKSRF